MEIQWLGHSAFKLTESTGTSIVTDPFSEKVVGYAMPKVSSDIVTISHSHDDHNAISNVEGNPEIINSVGSFEIDGVHIYSMTSNHDHHSGSRRGENLIFKIRMDGVDVCHLGDIGEECSIRLSEAIGAVDVLLIPIGGNYTISAEEAKEYVDLLMPNVVIPMHYKTRDCTLDIGRLEDFLDLFEDEQVIYVDNSIKFDRSEFLGEETKIVVFNK